MAILNSAGKLIANVSEPFKLFKTEDAFNTWVATLPTADDIQKFAVIKDWGNHSTILIKGSEYTFETSVTKALNFATTTFYEKDEVIYHDEMLYRAKVEFTSTADFVETDWEPLASAGVMENFTPNAAYKELEFITHEGKIYRAKTDFTATADFSATDWDYVSKTFVDAYLQNTPYLVGEVVFHAGDLYRAKTAATSPATGFVAANWERLVSDQLPQMTQAEWDALAEKPNLAIITDSMFDL